MPAALMALVDGFNRQPIVMTERVDIGSQPVSPAVDLQSGDARRAVLDQRNQCLGDLADNRERSVGSTASITIRLYGRGGIA